MRVLVEVAKTLSIDLSPAQVESFRTYLRELTEARSRAGLTSLTDSEAIQRRHFGEPLALLRALEDADAFGPTAVDIGPGAGFPGLPIKIVRPEMDLTLVEATGKRAAFLLHVIETLGLEGVEVVNARSETTAHEPNHRGAYRLVLARAVAPLAILVELALPFLQIGGYLATPKGSAAPREVLEAAAALEACGGQVEFTRPLAVPGPGPKPTLVLVRKIAETPDRYPRRPGIPAKRPLR
jgi:16S rRNA (guanine527-N7)-methyltransferase